MSSKGQKFLFWLFGASIFLCILVSLLIFFSNGSYDQQVSGFTNTVDPFVDALIVLGAVFIYKKIHSSEKIAGMFLVLSSVFLFTCDISFYVAVYIGKFSNVNAIDILAVPFWLWTGSLIGFFSIIIKDRILKAHRLAPLGLILLSKNILIICMYVSSPEWTLAILSFQGFYELSSAVLVLCVFDLVLTCLIYSEQSSVKFFLIGNIIILSGDAWIKYAYITRKMHMLPIGDLFWLLGLVITCFGLFLIIKEKAYNFNNWFRKTDAIKTRIVLWTFGVTIISFVLFLSLEAIFSVVNKQIFVGMPFFFMIYAATVVLLSIFIGRAFEAPFKKLENNIRVLLLDEDKLNLDQNFKTEEFRFLHKFILETYAHKEEKDRSQKKLSMLAAQVAHDIRSPLSALNTCLKHLPQIPENQRILMRNAANRINDIANNLLEQYKGKETAGNAQKKIWLLSPVVESIVSEKRLQFEGQPH